MSGHILIIVALLLRTTLSTSLNIQAEKGGDERAHVMGTYYNNTLTIKLLLNGTNEMLQNVAREVVVNSLWVIQKVDLPLAKKQIIWKILKDKTPVQSMNRSFFESAGEILLSMPENDLFNINVSDWPIVDLFGSLSGLSRRQAGIIGYALKKVYGEDLLQNAGLINRIKGLICGFSPQDLSTITTLAFTQIGMKVLLDIAVDTAAFGPPQAWKITHTKKLGLLVSAMHKDNLIKMRPHAVEGINSAAIKAMSREQLSRLTPAQVQYLSNPSLTAYRVIVGIPSSKQLRNHIIFFLICFTFILLLNI